MTNISPVHQRHIILDALRGMALLGICLANFPEFSLYTFQDNQATGAMSTAGIDAIVKYFQYIFIDGKFYTLFSLLFGIGFSIILLNAIRKKHNGIKIFYRRMFVLFLCRIISSDISLGRGFSTPVYFYCMNAQLKTMIDRTVARYTENQRSGYSLKR